MPRSDREAALRAAIEVSYPSSEMGVRAIPLDDAVDLILAQRREAKIEVLRWTVARWRHDPFGWPKCEAEIARLEGEVNNDH